MRTFIAIELPNALRTQIDAVQRALRADLHGAGLDRIRWTDSSKMHLTLRFLGNTNDEQRQEIEELLRTEAGKHKPFKLKVEGLGSFPEWNRLRVLWLGILGDLDNLSALQAAIEKNVQQIDLEAENRNFHPHITVGRAERRVSSREIRRMGSWLQDWQQTHKVQLARWTVDDYVLMRSQLHSSGATYTALTRWSLSGDA